MVKEGGEASKEGDEAVVLELSRHEGIRKDEPESMQRRGSSPGDISIGLTCNSLTRSIRINILQMKGFRAAKDIRPDGKVFDRKKVSDILKVFHLKVSCVLFFAGACRSVCPSAVVPWAFPVENENNECLPDLTRSIRRGQNNNSINLKE